MATIEDIEIYKQRYETFRHLDKIRWQMLQISVAVGTVSSAFVTNNNPNWWIVFIAGTVLTILSVVMIRIQQGIANNAIVLHEVGVKIGDSKIPLPTSPWLSRANWMAFVIMALGILGVIISAVILLG